MRDEIGFCIILLMAKAWGKTPIKGRPRSQQWWINRLEELRSEHLKKIPIILDLSPEKDLIDVPVPYEVEFDLDNKTDCTDYFSWVEGKKSFDKI